MSNISKATPDAFWANTRKVESGCIEWQSTPTKLSYGRLRVNGKHKRAHRHAYELIHGALPADVMVLHRCDNRICVNPEHLFLGDNFANMQDMAEKGRAAGFNRVGAKHPMAKLTNEIVAQYRARWKKRGRYGNGKQLAAELGMNYEYFVQVMNGKVRCWA